MKSADMPEHHRKAMSLIENGHFLRVVKLLMEGPKPFYQMADAVDPYISDKRMYMLVRKLQQAGIVEESAYNKRLLLTEYRLTEKGTEFSQILEAIHQWADLWESHPAPRSPTTPRRAIRRS